MAKETEDDGEHEHDEACDIRSGFRVASLPSNDRYQSGKRGSREQHAAGIDAHASKPFLEVIAVSFENKPLISEKREGDGEEICQEAGRNVSVGEQWSQ